MAAPIYFQHEVDALLRMGKRAYFEGLTQSRSSKAKRRRHNEWESVATVSLYPDPHVPGVGFEMQICHNLRTDHMAIQLFAEMHPRRMLPICRYEIQDLPHENYPPCQLGRIDGGQFHKHIYSEQAIIEGEPDDWDACAELLDIRTDGSPSVQLARLKQQFIWDFKINFEDRDTRNQTLNFGP